MYPDTWVGTDFYRTLGVSRGASPAEIKAEYRWLAKKFHPDYNPADSRAASKFQEIQEAFETLSDDERRGLYNKFLGDSESSDRDGLVQTEEPRFHGVNEEDNAEDARAQTRTPLFVGLSLAVVIGLVAALALAFSPAAQTETVAVQTVAPPLTATRAVENPYSNNDISACRSFLSWDIWSSLNEVETEIDRRAFAMRIEVEVPSFFYLADDEQLINIANAYSRAGQVLGIAHDGNEEALANMAIGNILDADGRQKAICGQVVQP
jgi:hypothetical protein